MLTPDWKSISKFMQGNSALSSADSESISTAVKAVVRASLLTLFPSVHSASEKCSTVATPPVQVICAYAGLTPCATSS